MPTAKTSRAGSRFYHGDDLTKTAADRKRTSSSEPWEKRRKAKKATKKATKKTARKTSQRVAGRKSSTAHRSR